MLALQTNAQTETLAREFAGIVSRETIARCMSESFDALSKAARHDYIPTLAGRFARERLRALAEVEGTIAREQPEVLYVCIHNAGRSQMAAALTRSLSDERVLVHSAGSEPGTQINPMVAEAMAELGLDMGEQFPKPLTDEAVRASDVVITMGCGDACPVYPGKRYLDWELDDPAGQSIEVVRRIRDEIRERVITLLADLGVPVTTH